MMTRRMNVNTSGHVLKCAHSGGAPRLGITVSVVNTWAGMSEDEMAEGSLR